MTIRTGISGWRYTPWRSKFYPEKLPQRLELAFASRVLSSIEINGTFYSLQRPESFLRWKEETPADFVFSVKGPRYITHIRRLKEIREPLSNFFASGVLSLEEKLGPILWQFPPFFSWKPERLLEFFKLLPQTREEASTLARKRGTFMKGRTSTVSKMKGPLLHAVEIRNESFRNDEFFEMAREFNIVIVVADTAGKWPLIESHEDAPFVYMRLHGDKKLYASGYTDQALKEWTQKVKKWTEGQRDAFIYFDNDVKVHAPFDAHRLAAMLGYPEGKWKEMGLGTSPKKKLTELPREAWPAI